MGDEANNTEETDNTVSLEDEMNEFDGVAGNEVTFGEEEEDESTESDDESEEDEDAEDDSEEETEESDSDEETEETDEGEVDEVDDEDLDDDETEELSDDQKTIEALREQITKMAKPAQTQTTVTETEETEEVEVLEDHVYATTENFDEILRDPEAFNKAVNAGVKASLEHANKINQQNATQAMALSLPQMVHTQVEAQRTLNESVQGFYKEHPTLEKYKLLVGQSINQVSADNPELDLTAVMKKAAKQTYEALGLAEKTIIKGKQSKGKQKAKNTGLRKNTKGSKRGKFKTQKSALQQEMDEL